MPRCFLLPLMDSIIDWQWEGKCSGQAVCAAGCSPASTPCWGGGSPRGTAEAGLQVGLKEEPQGAQGYSGNWGGGGTWDGKQLLKGEKSPSARRRDAPWRFAAVLPAGAYPATRMRLHLQCLWSWEGGVGDARV